MKNSDGNVSKIAKKRFFFALGPGDLLLAHQSWASGIRHSSEVGLTYSGQSMEFCQTQGYEALMISYCPRVDKINKMPFILENRPKINIMGRHGIGFFLSEALYAISLALSAIRFGAKVAVIDSGTSVWFMLWIFRLFGMKVIPNFHNTYHPVGYPPIRPIRKFIETLDKFFFRYGTSVSVGVSPACARQYEKMAGPSSKCFEFRCQFSPDDFGSQVPISHEADPFVLLFVGRVERNKGAFDLLDMVDALRIASHRPFLLEMCGGGQDMEAVQAMIKARNMSHLVKMNGRLKRADLLPIYKYSHLVIVPTRSDFCEGLAMVCVEAVLQGRPVITSRVVPAIEILGDALIEAETDNFESYVEKILNLMNDPVEYRRRVNACVSVTDPFLDLSFGLTAILQTVLEL